MTDRHMPYDLNKVTALDPKQNGENWSGGKELISTRQFVALLPKGHYSGKRISPVITVHCWMGRSRNASTVYCSIWAHSRDGEIRLAGSGKAGGYGYHKKSAALDEAMQNAGVTLARHFNGCGDRAMDVAIEALARKLGWRTGNVI